MQNTLNLGRTYWAGPDDREKWNWDQIPEMAVYRAHMKDQLIGTHNGGATIHAFGETNRTTQHEETHPYDVCVLS